MIPAALRDMSDLTAATLAVNPDVPGVDAEDHWAPVAPGEPDVMVRVYRPSGLAAPTPGFYWIHGGAMVVGSVAMDDLRCKELAAEMGCVVASVEYRLAPEHPYPAPADDCYAGLKWFFSQAKHLGVDPSRIVLSGASAGGGLAAALTLLARDRGEMDIACQHPSFQGVFDMIHSTLLPDYETGGGRRKPSGGVRFPSGQGTSAAAASPKKVASPGNTPTTSTATSARPMARERGPVGPVSVSSGISSGAWSNQAVFTTRA